MTTRQDPVGRLQLALAGATGAAGGTMPAADRSSAKVVIGSEHLLVSLLGEDDAAEAALAGLAVTSRTVFTVLRRKYEAASWSAAEQGATSRWCGYGRRTLGCRTPAGPCCGGADPASP
jgi:hypothetical protein